MYKIILLLGLSVMLHASVKPENVLTKNCLYDYTHVYKQQKEHKAFVYVRESETGIDRCGWGYGHESAEDAKASAMKQCTKFQLNAECIFVDVDDEYLVKEGDFSHITQPDYTPLSKELKDALLKEAKVLVRGNCLPFFKDYLNDNGHKAFAYSLDGDGKFACGRTYSSATLVAAKIAAVQGCKNNKNKRGNKKPQTPCRLYAEDNKILLHAKDYGISELPQVDKQLSDSEFRAKFTKAKMMIKKGACLFQMKYYLRGSVHQAYFLAQDKEGKQVCGRSEGELSENEAVNQALKACEKNLNKKNMIATCRLIAKDFDIVGNASIFEEKIEVVKITKHFQPSIKMEDLKNKNTVDMHKSLPLKETLKITAATLNKTLPTMVDSELRLERVESKESTMRFYYTLVHFTRVDMPEDRLKSLIYEDTKTQVCSDNDTMMLFKKGIKVEYIYIGKDKIDITTFLFDAKVCGVLTNVEQLKKNIFNLIKKK